MELSQYDLETNDDLSEFLFTSIGPNGKIKKKIKIQESERVDVTVAGAIFSYTAKYPEKWIYAKGSTKSRTRLYQMGLSQYLDLIKKDFELFGFINGQWQEFERGINYESFVVKRKINQNEKD